MIPLPGVLADKVRTFALSIPSEFIQQGVEGESGLEGDVHITVKYGLHTTNVGDVADFIGGVNPFWVSLGRITSFHGKDSVVLKVSVESPELFQLNKLVNKRFEHTDSFFEYKPHVTIAYLVHNPKDPYYYRQFCERGFEGEEFLADTIVFSTPQGDKTMIPMMGERTKIARRILAGLRGKHL
jgi:hypothetical protein